MVHRGIGGLTGSEWLQKDRGKGEPRSANVERGGGGLVLSHQVSLMSCIKYSVILLYDNNKNKQFSVPSAYRMWSFRPQRLTTTDLRTARSDEMTLGGWPVALWWRARLTQKERVKSVEVKGRQEAVVLDDSIFGQITELHVAVSLPWADHCYV